MANEFVRPGKGLINDQRCAAAVYRHLVRHGEDVGLGFGVPPESEEVFALSHPDDELDAIAWDWIELGEGAEPSRDDLEIARALTSGPSLAAALASSVELRRLGKSRHADVYRQLALIQMETFQRRARVGSGESNPLDSFAAQFEEQAAKKRFSQEAAALFRELSQQIALETPGPKSRDDDLSRVIERIRGLRAKTTEQGCTEQEALAAADKVAELLERYGVSLSEVDLRQQPCEGFGIDTGRRKHGAFDRCVPAIADFCDCRVWSEPSPSGTLRFVFFGLSADVEAAHYLYDLVAVAFEKRTKALRSGVASLPENPQNRRNDVRSSSASASLTSDRSYQIDRSSALNRANGGQAGSPFAEDEISTSCVWTRVQSISFTSSSNDDCRRPWPSPKPIVS